MKRLFVFIYLLSTASLFSQDANKILKNLYENIPNIIQSSKTIYENKIQNQSSLFSDENNKISYLIKEKKQSSWSEDEILSKEFESLGFYISNHPLKNYKAILNQYKVKSFKDFEESKDTEAFIAGTIMSIKEKKTTKGTPFAIVKFSDIFPVSLTSLDFDATEDDINYFTAEASFKYTVFNIVGANGNIL